VELKKHEPLKLVLLNRILIHQIREKIYLFIACAFEQDLDSPYEKKKYTSSLSVSQWAC